MKREFLSWHHFKKPQYAAFIAGLILMFGGLRGREISRLQAMLQELTVQGDQLQASLNQGEGTTGELLANAKTDLQQFEIAYKRSAYGGILDLRLVEAIVANAEGRANDALMLVGAEDEKKRRPNERDEVRRVLQVRGDAFYALHEWQRSMDCYERLLLLQPNVLVAIERIAACQYALGKRDEGSSTSERLTKTENSRGDLLLLQGKSSAGRHYQKAIQILTRLTKQEGRTELQGDLARSHERRGKALLYQGQANEALKEFENACAILEGLIESQGHTELRADLARNFGNTGNAKAFLGEAKLEAALADYEKAIQILSGLVEGESRGELANDLAAIENNRGAVRCAQGKLDTAVRDYEKAIQFLNQLAEKEGIMGSERAFTGNQINGDVASHDDVKLDVALEFSQAGLQALVRTRFVKQGFRRGPAVVLATTLRNRAFIRVIQEKTADGIEDLITSIRIYTRIIAQEGEGDLGPELAKSLASLAWIYATNSDSAFRNGSRAREYALNACGSTDWKGFFPLEALAAAFAENGDYVAAAKWESRALELAPTKRKTEASSRLELYRSANPYRSKPVKAS